MKLILASSSPRRAELLQDAGFRFEVRTSSVDESPAPGERPEELVQRLAESKAARVAARVAGAALVVGADTEVVLEGEIFGKAGSAQQARGMLEKLSGKVHRVLTGVCLIRLPDFERLSFVETTRVHLAKLSSDQISGYLATGEYRDKAGAYAIQGRAGRFIPRIEGCYFNVVGLPLSRLERALAELGYRAG